MKLRPEIEAHSRIYTRYFKQTCLFDLALLVIYLAKLSNHPDTRSPRQSIRLMDIF